MTKYRNAHKLTNTQSVRQPTEPYLYCSYYVATEETPTFCQVE